MPSRSLARRRCRSWFWSLSQIPSGAVAEFIEMVNKLAPQADRWDTIELFKRHFVEAIGSTHWRSSALYFAEHDLRRDASAVAANAPLFIEAFFDACRSFEAEESGRYAPDESRINAVLARHNIGFEIRGDRLLLRGTQPQLARWMPRLQPWPNNRSD